MTEKDVQDEGVLENVTKGLVLPTNFKLKLAKLVDDQDDRVQKMIDLSQSLGTLREKLFNLTTESLEADFFEIFKNFPSYKANDASLSERKEKSLNGYTAFGCDLNRSLVYGEVKFSALCEVLYNTTQLAPGGVFYDLGSGAGRGVFAAQVIHGFDKAYGIELLESLWKLSKEVLEEHKKTQKEGKRKKSKKKSNGLTKEPDIDFICGDICEYDWSDGDVIFINSTCFDYQLMEILSRKAEILKKGAYVLTLTKTLQSTQFELVESKAYIMSWGTGTVHTQRHTVDPVAKTVDLSLFKPPDSSSSESSTDLSSTFPPLPSSYFSTSSTSFLYY